MAIVNSHHRTNRTGRPMPTPARTSTPRSWPPAATSSRPRASTALTMQRVAAAVGRARAVAVQAGRGRRELVRLIAADVAGRAVGDASKPRRRPATRRATWPRSPARSARSPWPPGGLRPAVPAAARGLAHRGRPVVAGLRVAVPDGRGDRRARPPARGRADGRRLGERVRGHGARRARSGWAATWTPRSPSGRSGSRGDQRAGTRTGDDSGVHRPR